MESPPSQLNISASHYHTPHSMDWLSLFMTNIQGRPYMNVLSFRFGYSYLLSTEHCGLSSSTPGPHCAGTAPSSGGSNGRNAAQIRAVTRPRLDTARKWRDIVTKTSNVRWHMQFRGSSWKALKESPVSTKVFATNYRRLSGSSE